MGQGSTIAALATAPLAAGVAVIRVSGRDAKQFVSKLCPKFTAAAPRQAMLGKLYNNGELLDTALLLYFTAPASFTGEDVAEIHCHGGKAVVGAILDALYALGAVPAQRGDFTRRAYLNGRMDLTAAEGLADLIAAETRAQQQQALRQMQGELGQYFETLRMQVLHLLAHVEAAIDFPDEELDVLAEAGLANKLDTLVATLEKAIAQKAGERLREGFQVAIVGAPNVGKSTLTNLLTGRETAIVSPIAGTTRDALEARLNIAGYPVTLVDTAGLRTTDDVIEREGVARAVKRVQQADVVMLVTSAEHWPQLEADAAALLRPGQSLLVASKKDCVTTKIPAQLSVGGTQYRVLAVNLTEPQALDVLLPALGELIAAQFGQSEQAAHITRDRHRTALREALTHLQRAQSLFSSGHTASIAELMAQDLRDATRCIGRITGGTDTEDLLDLVFSTFCIGK